MGFGSNCGWAEPEAGDEDCGGDARSGRASKGWLHYRSGVFP